MSPFILGVVASSGGSKSAFVLISTYIVTGSTTSAITFNSIPGTYKHLQIHSTLRTTRPTTTDDPINVTFNADATAANYNYHYQGTDGGSTSVGSAGYVSGGAVQYAGQVAANSSMTDSFSAGVLRIPDYAGGNRKVMFGHTGVQGQQSSWYNLQHSTLWESGSAITSISFAPVIGPYFTAGSRISIYGLKG